MASYETQLREALALRHLNAVCLGGYCYLRLDGGNLAKAEFISNGGYYSGLRLTVLNRYAGPVDSITVSSWELPRIRTETKSAYDPEHAWDVCRQELNIEAFAEKAAEYLDLFTDNNPGRE